MLESTFGWSHFDVQQDRHMDESIIVPAWTTAAVKMLTGVSKTIKTARATRFEVMKAAEDLKKMRSMSSIGTTGEQAAADTEEAAEGEAVGGGPEDPFADAYALAMMMDAAVTILEGDTLSYIGSGIEAGFNTQFNYGMAEVHEKLMSSFDHVKEAFDGKHWSENSKWSHSARASMASDQEAVKEAMDSYHEMLATGHIKYAIFSHESEDTKLGSSFFGINPSTTNAAFADGELQMQTIAREEGWSHKGDFDMVRDAYEDQGRALQLQHQYLTRLETVAKKMSKAGVSDWMRENPPPHLPPPTPVGSPGPFLSGLLKAHKQISAATVFANLHPDHTFVYRTPAGVDQLDGLKSDGGGASYTVTVTASYISLDCTVAQAHAIVANVKAPNQPQITYDPATGMARLLSLRRQVVLTSKYKGPKPDLTIREEPDNPDKTMTTSDEYKEQINSAMVKAGMRRFGGFALGGAMEPDEDKDKEESEWQSFLDVFGSLDTQGTPTTRYSGEGLPGSVANGPNFVFSRDYSNGHHIADVQTDLTTGAATTVKIAGMTVAKASTGSDAQGSELRQEQLGFSFAKTAAAQEALLTSILGGNSEAAHRLHLFMTQLINTEMVTAKGSVVTDSEMERIRRYRSMSNRGLKQGRDRKDVHVAWRTDAAFRDAHGGFDAADVINGAWVPSTDAGAPYHDDDKDVDTWTMFGRNDAGENTSGTATTDMTGLGANTEVQADPMDPVYHPTTIQEAMQANQDYFAAAVRILCHNFAIPKDTTNPFLQRTNGDTKDSNTLAALRGLLKVNNVDTAAERRDREVSAKVRAEYGPQPPAWNRRKLMAYWYNVSHNFTYMSNHHTGLHGGGSYAVSEEGTDGGKLTTAVFSNKGAVAAWNAVADPLAEMSVQTWEVQDGYEGATGRGVRGMRYKAVSLKDPRALVKEAKAHEAHNEETQKYGSAHAHATSNWNDDTMTSSGRGGNKWQDQQQLDAYVGDDTGLAAVNGHKATGAAFADSIMGHFSVGTKNLGYKAGSFGQIENSAAGVLMGVDLQGANNEFNNSVATAKQQKIDNFSAAQLRSADPAGAAYRQAAAEMTKVYNAIKRRPGIAHVDAEGGQGPSLMNTMAIMCEGAQRQQDVITRIHYVCGVDYAPAVSAMSSTATDAALVNTGGESDALASEAGDVAMSEPESSDAALAVSSAT